MEGAPSQLEAFVACLQQLQVSRKTPEALVARTGVALDGKALFEDLTEQLPPLVSDECRDKKDECLVPNEFVVVEIRVQERVKPITTVPAQMRPLRS